MYKFIKHNPIFITLYALLFFWISSNYFKLRMLNFDQLYFSNKAMEGNFYKTLWGFIVEHQGRANFSLIPLSYLDYLLPSNKYYYAILSIVILVLISGVVGYFTYLLFKDLKLSLLISLILFAFNQITMEPIAMPTAYIGSYGASVIMLICSFVLFIKFITNNKKLYYIVSILLYLICLFSYENFVIYIFVYVLLVIKYNSSQGYKKNIKLLTPYLISLIIYLITYLVIKSIYGGDYSGSSISGIDLLVILKTFIVLALSSIPGFLIFNDSVAYHSPLRIYAENDSMLSILRLYNAEVFVVSIIFILVIYYLIYKLNFNCNKEIGNKIKNLHIFIIFIFFWLVPNFLYSISSGYQAQVAISYQQTTVGSYFGYISIVILISYFINEFLKKKQKFVKLLVFISIIICFYLISFSNAKISNHIESIYSRWELMDELLVSPEFDNVEDNSVIYAPTLFDSYALLSSVPSYYWSDYIKLKTGKNIIVLEEFNDEVFSYYIKFNQMYLDNNQYLIFSEVSESSNLQKSEIYSDYVTLYTKFEHYGYNVIGRANEVENIIELDNRDLFPTDDGFQFKVKSSGYTKHSLIGNKINANSIIITPSIANMPNIDSDLSLFNKKIGNVLSGANKISGFFEDGWVSQRVELEIKTGEIGEIEIAGFLVDLLPKNTLNIRINGENYTKEIDNNFIFTLEAPKNSVVKVNLNFEDTFVPAKVSNSDDLRELSAVITAIEGK